MATHTRSHTGTQEPPEDPVFGHLGVLAVDELDDKVQCHRCGRYFRSLATHVWRTHGMSADDYRAVFELTARHGLVSPGVAERRRRHALWNLRPYYERVAELAHSLSFEQRSAMLRGRRLRLETRLNPRWQASKQAMGRRQSARLREWYRSLDPAERAAFLVQFGPRRRRTPAICVVCDEPFFSASHGPRAKTCGPACTTLHRRRLGHTLRTSTRPHVRAQLSAAARRRRPEYDRIVTALQALDAAAFESLPAAEQDLVRGYYGLVPSGSTPMTLRELMEETGLARRQVEQRIRRAVLTLLDPDVASLVGLEARCVVCGQRFVREAGHSPRVICGPACAWEQGQATLRERGGQELLSATARQRGRTAGEQLRVLDEQQPAAFNVLPACDLLILRLYHGLPVDGLLVERPWTKREIAAHLGEGITIWQVTQALRRGLAQLFRPDEVRSDEERRATTRARLSTAARARGRPGGEALRALAPEVFARLPEPQRTFVRRYYGLEDWRPWTRRELAASCGRSTEWVSRLIAQGTAHLLDERAPRRAERPCIICGAAIAFEPGAYRSTKKTCSEACHRELRRRSAVASRAAGRGSA